MFAPKARENPDQFAKTTYVRSAGDTAAQEPFSNGSVAGHSQRNGTARGGRARFESLDAVKGRICGLAMCGLVAVGEAPRF